MYILNQSFPYFLKLFVFTSIRFITDSLEILSFHLFLCCLDRSFQVIIPVRIKALEYSIPLGLLNRLLRCRFYYTLIVSLLSTLLNLIVHLNLVKFTFINVKERFLNCNVLINFICPTVIILTSARLLLMIAKLIFLRTSHISILLFLLFWNATQSKIIGFTSKELVMTGILILKVNPTAYIEILVLILIYICWFL